MTNDVNRRVEAREHLKVIDGPQMFARYAYPPNRHGYCGPEDSDAVLQYGSAGIADRGFTELAQGFKGAWPYLELIAAGVNIRNPLDRRVVEAYWVGSPLLEKIGSTAICDSMEDRFRAKAGSYFPHVSDGVIAGGVPDHNFAVLVVSPWIQLMRDDRKAPTAVAQLDRCRIRWGQVVSLIGDEAVVRIRPLVWDGIRLMLGDPCMETAKIAADGTGFLTDLQVGDIVSLHWDWVCDRLTANHLRQLQLSTARHLRIANDSLRSVGSMLAAD